MVFGAERYFGHPCPSAAIAPELHSVDQDKRQIRSKRQVPQSCVQVLVYLHLRSTGFAPRLIVDDVTMKNIRLPTTLNPDQFCAGVYESRQPMWNAQHIREIDTCIPDLCGCIIHSGSLLIEMIFICYDVSQFWLRSFCFSSAYPTNPHDFALTRFFCVHNYEIIHTQTSNCPSPCVVLRRTEYEQIRIKSSHRFISCDFGSSQLQSPQVSADSSSEAQHCRA